MKKVISMVLVAAMILLLAGCGTEFDASGYVKSMLDTWYKGEYAQYMELTDATEAEAKDAHQQNLEVESGYFANYFYIEYMSDETKAKVMDLYDRIYDKAKYEVKEANKTKDGNYTVEVVLYPMDIMTRIDDDYTVYLEDFNSKAESGEFAELSEEEYEEEFTAGLLTIFEKHLPEIDYAEPKSLMVQVKEDENDKNVYYVSDEEMGNLDEWIIAY